MSQTDMASCARYHFAMANMLRMLAASAHSEINREFCNARAEEHEEWSNSIEMLARGFTEMTPEESRKYSKVFECADSDFEPIARELDQIRERVSNMSDDELDKLHETVPIRRNSNH